MAKKSAGGEELVNHYGLVRIHVNGSGNLQMTLFSLDEVRSNVLSPLALQNLTDVEKTVLSNFTQQRAKLQLKTTGLGDNFEITKIIIFLKPIAKSYPQ